MTSNEAGVPLKALVLAAGLGSRLRPVSGDRPKPLTPFGGASILSRNLRWLSDNGVTAVWINLHHRPEAICAEIGDGAALGLAVTYVHEPELLGTAGALANIAEVVDGTMLVVYGDNLVKFDLPAFARTHRRSGALATLALFDPQRHLHTGIAGGHVAVDEGGAVTAFREGPPTTSGSGGEDPVGSGSADSGMVNAGVYLVQPAILPLIPLHQPTDFGRDVFPAMLARGAHVQGHVIEDTGYCLGLDTPDSLAEGLRLLDEGRLAS